MISFKDILEDLEEFTRLTPSSVALAVLIIFSAVYIIQRWF